MLIVIIIFTAILNNAIKDQDQSSYKVSGFDNIIAAKKDYLIRVSVIFIAIGFLALGIPYVLA